MTAALVPTPSWRTRAHRFAPVTAVLSFGALAAAVVISQLPDTTPLLQALSTNVQNLLHTPVRVVIGSAFVSDSGLLTQLVAIVATAAAMFALERRIGSLRALGVFASAHVGATVLTEGAVWLGLRLEWLPGADRSQIDVGISYGMWVAVAAAAALLPRAWRWLLLPVALLGVGVPAVIEPSMTATGHLLSVLIGLAWWPYLLDQRGVWRRSLRSA
ncbi:MAG: hypothetical protein JO147_03950 [Actinobacteria bacterium]|nr:hypothetical protein [Actinomycetota bacterium]